MKYITGNRDVTDALRVILQDSVGMDKPTAAMWAQRIDAAACTSCGAIRALEARCRQECAAPVDPTGRLRVQLQLYDKHLSIHGDPLDQPHRTLREETFRMQLNRARRVFVEGSGEFLASPAKVMLLTELSIRNELYDAMESNYLDISQPLRADRISHRNCAYTLAVWMRNSVPDDDLSTPALLAAALDRLGYLDPNRIARLHAAVQHKLNEME